MAGIITYVKEPSGGLEDPHILWDLRDFIRVLQTVRVARGNVLQAVARAAAGSPGAAALVRNAVVKAIHAASDKFACGPEQNLCKTSDVRVLPKFP